MDSEEILERYRASYDAPQPFDPKHPEEQKKSSNPRSRKLKKCPF